MEINKVIRVLQNETECIKRANTCDRNCGECNLVLPDTEILAAYETAIDLLTILGKEINMVKESINRNEYLFN